MSWTIIILSKTHYYEQNQHYFQGTDESMYEIGLNSFLFKAENWLEC